ncbi:hypothetical protein V6N12_027802 [Hibiscus sabdariffa]|uniref:Erect panicle 2 protein n=1 Tax=Hibiscus sabdariffa TaxID=183260 RepID=A0ABR2F3Z3_9ROSI
MDVVVEKGVSMNGNADVSGSKGTSCLEDHGDGMQSPLKHGNRQDANQGETRQVSFRDMVMGHAANDSQIADLDVLEVEITDADVSIGKEGLLPEIKFSKRPAGRPLKPSPLGYEGGSIYGPWMQAQGSKRRSMLARKYAPAATSGATLQVGGSGSRFSTLNLEDDSTEIVADANDAHLRELVINAGPIAAAKGKDIGLTDVGSSKGTDLRKGRARDEVYSSLDALRNFSSEAPQLGLDTVVEANKDNVDVNSPVHVKSVAAKGSIIRMNSSLNSKSHMVVRIDDDGSRNVSRNVGDRSMSGPIRSSGVRSANRMAASAKSIYKQGPRLHKKEIKKGPDKPVLGDWLPPTLTNVSSKNSIGSTGGTNNGRPLEGDPSTGVKPDDKV